MTRKILITGASGQVDSPAKPRVTPIATHEYSLPAPRPAYSLPHGSKLADTFGVRAPDWRAALDLCLGAEAPLHQHP